MIEIEVNGTRARCVSGGEMLTSGCVGLVVKVAFSPEWRGLIKTAIVRGSGKSLETLVSRDDALVVPHECMTEAGSDVKIGLYGMRQDGTVVIPTVYCALGTIQEGTVPTGENGEEPTPSVFNQMVAIANEAIGAAQTSQTAAQAAQAATSASAQTAEEAASSATAAAQAAASSEATAQTAAGNAQISQQAAGQYSISAGESAAAAEQSAANAKASMITAATSEIAAVTAASEAKKSADKAETAISNGKFLSCDIGEDGRLYFNRTHNAQDVNMTLDETGRLVLEIE